MSGEQVASAYGNEIEHRSKALVLLTAREILLSNSFKRKGPNALEES